MFKTILAAATAALVLATVAPPAHAGVRKNGVESNGSNVNGLALNGLRKNGRSWQGTSTGATGFAIDAIELPAAR